MRNKQSFIALFVLLVMVFNACDNGLIINYETTTTTNEVGPILFYVDSNGDFSETDSGRSVVLANENADVIFYSDDIDSGSQQAAISFDDKNIIFLFDENENFPTKMTLSDSEDSYNGFFTPYDPVTQTYSLIIETDDEMELYSDIALNSAIFTQYTDDPELTQSQNLRMRNMQIAMCIYISFDDYITENDNLGARGIFSWAKKILKKFIPAPIVNIVVGVVQVAYVVSSLFNPVAGWELITNGFSVINNAIEGITSIIDGVKELTSTTVYAPSIPFVAVTGVSLNKSSSSIVIGDAETLISSITPTNATNKNVSWSSSNPAAAIVASNGTVISQSIGTTTITATTSDGGKTASCVVTVIPIPVSGVTLNKSTTGMLVGGTETLTATIMPTNAANKSVSWSSSNSAVATVSNNGVVTGASVGTAVITVTTSDGGKTASCEVTVSAVVVNVTGVSLNKTAATIAVDDVITLTAIVTPANATNQNVTWSSSNSSIAAVSNNGVVTGVSSGTATITVTAYGGKTSSCLVKVSEGTPGLSYSLINGGTAYKVLAGTASGDVVIPLMYNELPVTAIGDCGFERKENITSITIPNSVTSIGWNAFHDCTSLTSITIPNSVTSIADTAFWGCTSLTSVTIPNSITSIGSGAFHDCTSLTSITIPSSVTSIADAAFWGCTSLTSVTIPNSITSIGPRVFSCCTSLVSIYVDAGNPNYSSDLAGILYNKNKTILLQVPGGITSVTIPNSVTYIGDDAFRGCTSLTSVTIPNSVTSIGEAAFYACTSLTSVTIPSSVTSIGWSAFYGCTSLTSVTVNATVPPSLAGFNVFNQNHTNLQIKVPAASVNAYKAASGWSEYASRIVAQ